MIFTVTFPPHRIAAISFQIEADCIENAQEKAEHQAADKLPDADRMEIVSEDGSIQQTSVRTDGIWNILP